GAVLAGILDDAALAAALGAGLRHREEALRELDAARALAAAAALDAGAGLGARALAGVARRHAVELKRQLRAVGRVLEPDVDLVLEVVPAPPAAAGSSAAPAAALRAEHALEEVAEDVADVDALAERVLALEPAAEAAGAALHAGLAELVVQLAL